jgi:hypothetical protein
MQFTHRLARHLVVSRGVALAAALAVVSACDSSTNPGELAPGGEDGSSVVTQLELDDSLATGVNQQVQLTAQGRSPTGDSASVEVDWSASGGTIDSTGTFVAAQPGRYTVVARGRENKALEDSTVVVVSTSPPSAAVSLTGEQAVWADSFVNSISVQTHLRYTNIYSSGWSSIIKPRLLELGVRHIRDGSIASSSVISRYRDLAANGIKLTAGCMPVGTNWSNVSHCLTQFNAIGPTVIEAVEGANEVDTKGGDWITKWTQWQGAFWKTFNSHSVWGQKPIIASSVAMAGSASKLGNRSGVLDLGNMHSYPGSNMPSIVSQGWIPNWTQVASPKPLVATETGYHNSLSWTGGNPPISERGAGKYYSRLFFEYFNRGVRRTNAYELIDEGTSSNREHHFGLLRNNGSPKPAFTAIKNIIALLKDPGSSFAPGRLSYGLSGALSTTHRTVLQKRDGRFYLVLWQEISVWDRSSKRDLTTSNDDVTLTLGQAASSIKVYRPLQGTTPVQTGRGSTINLSVPDEALVVEITP